METTSIDYPYVLSLIERINRFVESEPELAARFNLQGYNLWERYQGLLFADAKTWSREKRLSRTSASARILLKTSAVSLILLAVSVASVLWAALSRKRVWIFTGDHIQGSFKNDVRLLPLYEALSLEKASFFEVVHTQPGRQTLKNLTERARPVLYFESLNFALGPVIWRRQREARRLVAGLDLGVFNEAEKPFVAFELEKFLSQTAVSIARLNIFSFLLRFAGAALAFSIDDTRYYQEFGEAARRAGVPSYAIQHGHFTKYHIGWLKKTRLPGKIMMPGTLLVWSDYWKKELQRLGTYFGPQEIVVGGDASRAVPEPREAGKGLSILIPYEKDAPKAEVRSYIDAFLEMGAEVIFKIRADQDKLEQLEEYGLRHLDDRITVVRSVRDVLSRVSLAAGTYSTFLYDLAALECPVAILKTSLDYGEGMVENGLAALLGLGPSLESDVRTLAATPLEELRTRRHKLESGKDLERSLRAIIKAHA